jgi:hypothetical protein
LIFGRQDQIAKFSKLTKFRRGEGSGNFDGIHGINGIGRGDFNRINVTGRIGGMGFSCL